MQIFKTIKSIRKAISFYKKQGYKIALVPTMGALHEGHLSLIKIAKSKADIVIVSIFVNQKQFNNWQDFKKYPQTLATDSQLLKNAEVDALFIPSAEEIYPAEFFTNITMGKLADYLCGQSRPGHFNGVVLVVSKLFNIITPDFALFGEKDFQQLQIIRHLVQDLNFNLQIIAAPIIREKSGLAQSSRNLRLSEKERGEIAPKIYQILKEIRQKICDKRKVSNKDLKLILVDATNHLLKSGFTKIDYLQICDETNLKPLNNIDSGTGKRIFIAIYIGQIRLIDNLPLY